MPDISSIPLIIKDRKARATKGDKFFKPNFPKIGAKPQKKAVINANAKALILKLPSPPMVLYYVHNVNRLHLSNIHFFEIKDLN